MTGRTMLRHAAALSACVLFTAVAHAAEITGSVIFAGKRPGKILAGYSGVGADGTKVTNMAGMTIGAGSSSVECTTYRPRNSRVNWDPRRGCTFSHVELPPGRYVVYVKSDDNYIAHRLVTLTASRPRVSLTFTCDANSQGDLVLRIARTGGPYNVRISPLVPGADVASEIGTDTDVSGRSVVLKGMRPGRYKADLRLKQPRGGGSYLIKEVGSWTVDVVAGKEREYQMR